MFLSGLGPSAARAQVADGRRYLEEADFERAVQAFNRAEREESLDRTSLVALYEGRALARWATGDERGARRDLLALSSLDPEHRWPDEAPPELVTAFREVGARTRISLEVTWSDRADGTTVRTSVRDDPGAVVRRVRTHVRTATGGPWRTEDGATVDVVARPGASVDAWVEALGPGGAIVARAGTEGAPIRHVIVHEEALSSPTASEEDTARTEGEVSANGGDDTALWIGVGVGAALLAAGAVVLAVVLGSGQASDAVQPTAPMVTF